MPNPTQRSVYAADSAIVTMKDGCLIRIEGRLFRCLNCNMTVLDRMPTEKEHYWDCHAARNVYG